MKSGSMAAINATPNATSDLAERSNLDQILASALALAAYSNPLRMFSTMALEVNVAPDTASTCMRCASSIDLPFHLVSSCEASSKNSGVSALSSAFTPTTWSSFNDISKGTVPL